MKLIFKLEITSLGTRRNSTRTTGIFQTLKYGDQSNLARHGRSNNKVYKNDELSLSKICTWQWAISSCTKSTTYQSKIRH